MKYEDIKSEIISMQFKPVYLLYGDDEYLKQTVYNVLKTSITKSSNKEFDEFKYDENSDINDIINECYTYSFTGNSKFIRCKNTNFFSKEENNETLSRIMDSRNDDIYIFFIESNVDKRLLSFKQYNKQGYAYDLSKGKPEDVKRFIQSQLKKEDKTISFDNLNLFIEYSGLNLAFVSSNIDKIVLYMKQDKAVTEDMIKLLCNGITDVKTYELCGYLFKKDLSNALTVYYDMVALKYGIPYFLAILFNTFYEMYNLKIQGIQHSSDFRTQKAIGNTKNFTNIQLVNILKEIREFDHDFKTGKIDQDSSMIILLSKIVNT